MYMYQVFTTFSTLIPVLIYSLHESWTSVYVPKLLVPGVEYIQITSDEGALIVIFLSLGGLLGSMMSLVMVDKLSRRNAMFVTSVPYLLSSLLLAFYNSLWTICLARFFIGTAFGVTLATVPLYLGEIADAKIRGYLQTNFYLFELTGMLVINVAGFYFNIRTTSFISVGLIVIFMASFIWVPESPYYLVMIGQDVEAKSTLEKLRGTTHIAEDFDRIKAAVKDQVQTGEKFRQLYTLKTNRRALLTMFIVLNGKQLSGNAAIDIYAQSIFQQVSSIISPLSMTVIFYLTKVITIILTLSLIDKVGRRVLLLVSLLTTALVLLLLGVCSYLQLSEYIEIFLLLTYALFSCFLLAIPVILLGELFPVNVKSLVSLLFSLYFFGTVMALGKFFQFCGDNFGTYVAFLVFSGSCLVHFALAYVFVFETKGKTLEEIQEQLDSIVQ